MAYCINSWPQQDPERVGLGATKIPKKLHRAVKIYAVERSITIRNAVELLLETHPSLEGWNNGGC